MSERSCQQFSAPVLQLSPFFQLRLHQSIPDCFLSGDRKFQLFVPFRSLVPIKRIKFSFRRICGEISCKFLKIRNFFLPFSIVRLNLEIHFAVQSFPGSHCRRTSVLIQNFRRDRIFFTQNTQKRCSGPIWRFLTFASSFAANARILFVSGPDEAPPIAEFVRAKRFSLQLRDG